MSNARRLIGQACFTLLLIVFTTPFALSQVTVELPDLDQSSLGQTISVPIELGNVESTSGFSSFQFRVVSSSTGVVFEGHDDTATLVSNFTATNSSTTSNLVGGFVSSNLPATTSGTLIFIKLRIDAIDAGAKIELQEFKLTLGASVLNSTPFVPMTEFAGTTAAEDEFTIPDAFVLKGNYPNPFNPSTNIQFDLKEASTVQVSVMDLLGRTMLTVPSQTFSAGSNQTIAVDAASLTSGIYIYRVVSTSATRTYVGTGTMSLIK